MLWEPNNPIPEAACTSDLRSHPAKPAGLNEDKFARLCESARSKERPRVIVDFDPVVYAEPSLGYNGADGHDGRATVERVSSRVCIIPASSQSRAIPKRDVPCAVLLLGFDQQ